MCQKIEDQLESDVETGLYRASHERRSGVSRHSQARCQRCGSHWAQKFRRNGHRKRQLVTTQGIVDIGLPRVVCLCGGSVQIPFSILQPYQRIWKDVELQIVPWTDLGLSLRQMLTQPQFIKILQRDWTETIAFFRVLKRFPHWQRTALRTTSLLERVNRMLRRLFRPKGAFHSKLGLSACVTRVLAPKRLI